MTSLTVIVLTYNEARHIERCIASARRVALDIVVVDSESTDETLSIATRLGARVYRHRWVNHAEQLNWALGNINIATDWVMRLDADEYLDDELVESLNASIAAADDGIGGFEVRRYIVFQGKLIRHGGGVSPGKVLRVWRTHAAVCEQRWMDEHMLLSLGRCICLAGSLIDCNLNPMTWWIGKHNEYASREAIALLDIKYGFLGRKPSLSELQRTARIKRALKERVYARIPGIARAWIYFVYRVVIRLGFLDGSRGMAFHFMQGLWYRMLVDIKVGEVMRFMSIRGCSAPVAIHEVLGIKVPETDGRNDVSGNL